MTSTTSIQPGAATPHTHPLASALIPSASSTLAEMLAHFMLLEPVFDAMPDIVFFVKDRETHYAMANRARRFGHKDDKSKLLGTRPPPMSFRAVSAAFTTRRRIRRPSRRGHQLIDQLELHLYPAPVANP